ncbi:heavy-metal-associated domain-containing protein [Daejeonella oryzae]|uniref:heavy-metal-associated domain-containing protein n=1 Tax=Daejeonella oryzae TaxID=1122943 RepID=UPI00041C3165|nr:heavy-metal-associated domain-containing protein [Daejeonella oryzae]
MKTLKFKTNIKCGGCIAAVTPVLNKKQAIENWQVDTSDPDKILTVNAEDVSAEEIISDLKLAGYEAQQI